MKLVVLTTTVITMGRTAGIKRGRAPSLGVVRRHKRAKVHGNRVRRVVRRSGTLHRRRAPRKIGGEFSGGFTKCFKKRWVNRRRGGTFARRVKQVLYGDQPRNTHVADYGLTVQDNVPDSAVALGTCYWFQLGLDYLYQPDPVTGGYGYAVAGQLDSYSSSGLLDNILCSSSGVNGGAPVSPPTHWPGIVNTILSGSTQSIQSMEYNTKVSKQYSSMKVQLKNPRDYAICLELYTVRPKKRMTQVVTETNFGGNSTPSESSPLEAFVRGFQLNAIGNQCSTLELNSGVPAGTYVSIQRAVHRMSTQLNDSSVFRNAFKITKKCKVYVPAGGMLEKSLVHMRRRTFSSNYLTHTAYDRGTEWIVGRVITEPILGNYNTGAVPFNAGKPVIVGTVSWRYTLKNIVSSASGEAQDYHHTGVPTTTAGAANQSYMTHFKG